MVDRNDRFYLTAAEMLVMRVVWLADHDLVLSEVVNSCNEDYGKNWKPQTVSTYLSHLVQKEFLRMDRNGKIYRYHPLVSWEDYLKYDVTNFMRFWGLSPAELMKSYMEICGYSAEDCEKLRDYIQELRAVS